jgi:hypothetical protein
MSIDEYYKILQCVVEYEPKNTDPRLFGAVKNMKAYEADNVGLDLRNARSSKRKYGS